MPAPIKKGEHADIHHQLENQKDLTFQESREDISIDDANGCPKK